jgi:hypothetical protein
MGDYDDDNALCIGDYITLKNPRYEGSLMAYGFLDDKSYLESSIDAFENCIFQICIANQYSAAKELNEFLEREGLDYKQLLQEEEERTVDPDVDEVRGVKLIIFCHHQYYY